MGQKSSKMLANVAPDNQTDPEIHYQKSNTHLLYGMALFDCGTSSHNMLTVCIVCTMSTQLLQIINSSLYIDGIPPQR